MKYTYAFIFLAFAIVSCKKPDLQVQVANDTGDTLTDVRVGPARYGIILPGQVTGYQRVPEGQNDAYAKDQNTGAIANGSVDVYGHGKHYWTLSINKSSNAFDLYQTK